MIKLTPEYIEQCKNEFAAALSNGKFSDGKVTISLPYDIMDWVKLQHKDVVEEDIILPTNVNHNVAYIALEIKVGEETYLYPIKFDLNGVWTKVYLDKNEIVFCD